jgi:hypothetical protein
MYGIFPDKSTGQQARDIAAADALRGIRHCLSTDLSHPPQKTDHGYSPRVPDRSLVGAQPVPAGFTVAAVGHS